MEQQTKDKYTGYIIQKGEKFNTGWSDSWTKKLCVAYIFICKPRAKKGTVVKKITVTTTTIFKIQ